MTPVIRSDASEGVGVRTRLTVIILGAPPAQASPHYQAWGVDSMEGGKQWVTKDEYFRSGCPGRGQHSRPHSFPESLSFQLHLHTGRAWAWGRWSLVAAHLPSKCCLC